MLEEGDVGFISGPSSKPDISSNKVFSDQVILVSSGSRPAPNEIALEELPRYPLIWSTQLVCVQRSLAQAMTADVKLNIMYNLDSIEAVKLAAIRGHGAAFLPYMSIKKELYNKQLKAIQIRDLQVYNEIYMVKKRTQKCNRDTKQLIQYIEQTLIDTLC
ncbi:HTH-type transcriptional activator CmpR [compost metagenome]